MICVRTTTLGSVATLAITVTALTTLPGLTAAPAHARADTSLAGVLAEDGNRFDGRARDFDVADRALHRVLATRPDSTLRRLTNGDRRLTAFLPTDRAFELLVQDLTGKAPPSEEAACRKLIETLGLDTVETILLYHVVPRATLDLVLISQEDGVMLTMASYGNVGVNVTDAAIRLADADTNDTNARLLPGLVDINSGHRQLAHGINRVLRPSDL